MVLSWQEITEEEGCYSLNDTLGDLARSEEANCLVETEIMARLPKRKGPDGKENEAMKELLKTFTVIRLIRMSKAGFEKEELLDINRRLNAIRKP